MTDNQIIEAVENYPTMARAAKSLGISYSTFKRKAIKLNVWRPNQGAKNTRKILKDLNNVFTGKATMRTYNLKARLFADGYKEVKCESCGIEDTWNGKDIVLELDHINGDRKDNSLENLRILCPNCHSQTKTFRGRNHKKHKVL